MPLNENLLIELTHKFLTDDLTQGERNRLYDILSSSEEAKQLHEEIVLSWQLTDTSPLPFDLEEESAFDSIKEKLNPEDKTVVRTAPRWRSWISIAALGLLFLTSWFLYQNYSADEWKSLKADDGMLYVELSDGSKIWLDENAQLRYPPFAERQNREIEIAGTAYIEVAPNPKQPFIVDMNTSMIRVIGTKFMVDVEDETQSVHVTEGKVALISKVEKDSIYLSIGMKGVHNSLDGMISQKPMDNSNHLFWKDGRVSYNAVPLSQILSELEILFSVEITLENTGLKDCPISGIFIGKDMDSILNQLAEPLGIRSLQSSNQSYRLLDGTCKE